MKFTPVAGFVALLASSASHAQSALVDPTRPYSGVPDEAPVYSGPVLQSTLVSDHRREAMISGRKVRIGDRVGAAVVADIRPYEVVLRQDNRETRLRLTPKLDKEPTLRHSSAQAQGRTP